MPDESLFRPLAEVVENKDYIIDNKYDRSPPPKHHKQTLAEAGISTSNPKCSKCGRIVKKLKAKGMCSRCYDKARYARLKAAKQGEIKPVEPVKPDISPNITDNDLRSLPIVELVNLNMDPYIIRDIIKKRMDLDWKDPSNVNQRNLVKELEEVYEYLRLIGKLDEFLALGASRVLTPHTEV